LVPLTLGKDGEMETPITLVMTEIVLRRLAFRRGARGTLARSSRSSATGLQSDHDIAVAKMGPTGAEERFFVVAVTEWRWR